MLQKKDLWDPLPDGNVLENLHFVKSEEVFEPESDFASVNW